MLAHRSFLVDTNVIGHVIRARPKLNAGIQHFFETVDEDRLYLSALTIGELQKGIDLLPWPTEEAGIDARRKLQAKLENRLEALCARFGERIIVPDLSIVRQWGRFHAERERLGKKTPVVDTMIAASAHSKQLIVATGDADFHAFGQSLTLYNPTSQELSGYPIPFPFIE